MELRSEARTCGSKFAYFTKKAAKRAARQTLGDGLTKVRPYRCPYCNRFHNGHSSAGFRESVRSPRSESD